MIFKIWRPLHLINWELPLLHSWLTGFKHYLLHGNVVFNFSIIFRTKKKKKRMLQPDFVIWNVHNWPQMFLQLWHWSQWIDSFTLENEVQEVWIYNQSIYILIDLLEVVFFFFLIWFGIASFFWTISWVIDVMHPQLFTPGAEIYCLREGRVCIKDARV